MKWYFHILIITLLFNCNNPPEKESIKNSVDIRDTTIVSEKSMKGFDLYAWEKDGNIFFTLLRGTNRNKTSEEIYDPKNAVQGISAIEKKIDEIASGEYIVLDPTNVDVDSLSQLIDYMKRKNLQVSIR